MVALTAPDPIKQPPHPDGEKWLVIWVAPDGCAIFADSISDIVAEIIPGYADLEDDEDDAHLQARTTTLAHLATIAQSAIVSDAGNEFSAHEVDVASEPKDSVAKLESWGASYPLLLLTVLYEPFTEVVRPSGAIVWLDSSNEVAFLNAAQTLGHGELWVAGI